MRDSPTTPVGLLKMPSQPRAKATLDSILESAINILQKEGIVALNTNHIADTANINVGTLYGYFPNKEAILEHLAHKYESERVSIVERHASQLGLTGSWTDWLRSSIDHLVDFRLEEPGCVVIRQSLTLIPELAVYDRLSTKRAIDALIPGLIRLNSNLTEEKARLIAAVWTVSVTNVLDAAFATTPYNRQMIAELKTMIEAYLERYLNLV